MATSGVIPDSFCGDESPTVVDFAEVVVLLGRHPWPNFDSMSPLVGLQGEFRRNLDFM